MSTLLDDHYALRADLVARLHRDLIGPGEELETLTDAPETRYAAGMLFPVGVDEDGAQDDETADAGDDSHAPDPGVARASARFPSSCGITFAVDATAEPVLRVNAGAARYVPYGSGDVPLDPATGDRYEMLNGEWRREPIAIEPIDVPTGTAGDTQTVIGPDLSLFVRVRERDGGGARAVTVVLRNTRIVPGAQLRDPHICFQVGLEVTAQDGAAVFVDRTGAAGLVIDEELDSYRLLYRHARSFAVGHGCSATWSTADGDPERATAVRTDFMPEATVDVAESNPAITSEALSMAFCADASDAELFAALRDLVDGYQQWIDDNCSEAAQLADDLRLVGERNLDACTEVTARLTRAIQHLASDPDSLRAFRFANEAMREQRARSSWLAAGAAGEPDRDGDGRWRPFQLAFILLCIEGIADPASDDRVLADLLWFPTGGGKTEAYLGLIAFTLFRRRLARTPEAAEGVTVMMRYTLRLLTMQQFARASLLICCCEDLRRRTIELGRVPITVGLWIGAAGTPNRRDRAATVLNKLKQGVEVVEENPMQLHSCPWCGVPLRAGHYWMGEQPPRLAISCRNKSCEFAKGLPVYVVDEDIYDYRPSLLIATADKFAALPSNERVGSLFGIGTGSLPPELIVQDELHLISGPLGTLAGLYETTVDWLCQASGARPKVVASTATIRKAGDQTSALFDREMRQFPPPGIDARDSYFAVDAPADRRGNRLYVGVMTPAKSQTTSMVRVFAGLLAGVEQAEDLPPAVRDPYWTLVGYFNSLRVLGGARIQVQDDVVDYMKLLLGDESTRTLEPIEMTSNVGSAEIPEHLSMMQRSLGEHEEPIDVVLATNMISVGVDVDRLGLMTVMGQPQGTAEYIQASSRVGRRHPGLIVTIFNSSRSRDRSHYESFMTYHSALYRQVESTSVTPFASRARDRALHAVFVALCRLTIPALADNRSAALIAQHRGQVEFAKQVVLERVGEIAPDQVGATSDELDNIVERWESLAQRHPNLVYRSWHPKQKKPCLLTDAAESGELGSFPTLSSLRDVDLETTLALTR